MLNSNSIENVIQLPTYPTYRILSKNKVTHGVRIVVMIAIDKQEEAIIDEIDRSTLTFHRGNRSFSVQMRDIYCYGEVDFNDKDILDEIDSFKFLDCVGGSGIPIRSNYDYETHSCVSPNRSCLWSETWSPAKLAKMAHGFLGKPKRILLFNKVVKKW